MHGESPYGHDAEPGRGPLPPTTTRWSESDGPDPGATGQRLAPFRAGAPSAPVAAEADEPVGAAAAPFPTPAETESHDELEQPVIAAAVEEMGLIDEPADEVLVAEEEGGEESWTLVPRGEQVTDAAPVAEADARSAGDDVAAEEVATTEAAAPAVAPWEGLPDADYFSAQPAELEVEALPVEEEPWTLTADAVIEASPDDEGVEPWAAVPDQDTLEGEPMLELVDEVEAPAGEVEAADEVEAPSGEVGAPVDEVEPTVPPLDTLPEHQQWDAFGRALKEAVSWEGAPASPPDAPPPWMVPEILRAESSAEEWQTAAGPPSPEVLPEVGVDVTAAGPEPAATGGDAFSGELADRLQSLADRLRSQGAGAIADALSSGDRLEASIALFLAGYQVGRGR